MPTIIEQIQRDALDPNVPVSALLRRVKLAAVKLGLGSIEDWVDQELNGYKGDVPEYRSVPGHVRALNPQNGWMPLLGNPELVAKLSTTENRQPIASIEELLSGDGDEFLMEFGPHLVSQLNEAANYPWPRYALHIGRGSVVKIVDRVRTLVLDWALNVERAGITGSDFSFSAEEKKKAQAGSMTITIGNIGSFAGNLGSGNNSGDITASNINVDQVQRLVEQVRQYADDLVKAGADRYDLERELSAIEHETSKSSPDSGILRGLITDLRNTISGAAGSLVASGVIAVANQILGTGVPGG